MPRVRIVTDSTAHFEDPDFPRQHNVSIVPLTIHFGKDSFRDGVNINTESFFNLVETTGLLPTVASPTQEQFAAVYEEITRTSDSIVSIHLSSKLGRAWRNASAASEPLLGRCNIQVIDSLSTSMGLGWLVEAAARAAEAGESADEIVRIVRGLTSRLYIVFFVETPTFLANSKRFGKAQAALSPMLGIKPFLAIEDGDIVAMEKVRSRQQAVEKLVEFVAEFSALENLAILQHAPGVSDESRLLLNQLAIDFPGRKFPVVTYGPSLATYIGPEAMGVIVFEGEDNDD
ncbi:MAG: DegV family protein [Chloroflexi bacterium]|nr:DegV family protein [Chloroflexota bacterium]